MHHHYTILADCLHRKVGPKFMFSKRHRQRERGSWGVTIKFPMKYFLYTHCILYTHCKLILNEIAKKSTGLTLHNSYVRNLFINFVFRQIFGPFDFNFLTVAGRRAVSHDVFRVSVLFIRSFCHCIRVCS